MSYLVITGVLWAFMAAVRLAAQPFTAQQAETLVMNVPDALKAKRQGSCISADSSQLDRDIVLFQLRNKCPRSGTGLIGNYVVDLRSGRVWSDIDRQHEVDSKHLRKIRKRIRPGQKTG